MSTIGVVRDLTEFFLSAGWVGAALAALCALVVLIALARGSGAVAGGAAAVWIGGALLSLTAGFSGQWWPAIVAGASLAAALVLGGGVRLLVRTWENRADAAPTAASDARPAAASEAAPAPAFDVRPAAAPAGTLAA